MADTDEPLAFLVHEGGAQSLTDAAYRFARHEAGTDIVLFGTSRREHLRSNIASILRPHCRPTTSRDCTRCSAHSKASGSSCPTMCRLEKPEPRGRRRRYT
ncbi:MAG: hypothetical protein R3E68_01865 [Burkholderiaceae bacterium]